MDNHQPKNRMNPIMVMSVDNYGDNVDDNFDDDNGDENNYEEYDDGTVGQLQLREADLSV